jgi:hypothetical protein
MRKLGVVNERGAGIEQRPTSGIARVSVRHTMTRNNAHPVDLRQPRPFSTITSVELQQARSRFLLRPSALAQVDKLLECR